MISPESFVNTICSVFIISGVLNYYLMTKIPGVKMRYVIPVYIISSLTAVLGLVLLTRNIVA